MIIWDKKIIWWLLLVHAFNEIRGFIPLLNSKNSINFYKHQQLGQLIKMCFTNHSNPLVLTDNLINIIDRNSQESIRSPISIIDDNFKAKNIQIFNPARPTYFLSTDSDDKLNDILQEFESMTTWSIESLFFIVDLTDDNHCKDASRVLEILWKKELLSSFFVCNEPQSDTILIFTLNPYGPHASHPWKKVETINDNDNQSDNRRTLFHQSFINDDSICQNLTYDKTKVLDGYPVKAVGTPKLKPNWTSNEAHGKEVLNNKTFSYFHSRYFSTLFSAINVTPIIYFDKLGYYQDGKIYGFLKPLVNGTYDIGIGLRQSNMVPNELIDTVQLYNEDGYLIMTLKRQIEIPLQTVTDYYTVDIIVLMWSTLLITFIAILINRRRLSDTILDILQLVLGAGIMTTLERFSMRLVFVIATVVIFILRPALDGTLSALMSSPERIYVENLDDLHTLKYNVYVHTVQKQFIEDEKLWIDSEYKYLHYMNDSNVNCDNQTLNDSTVACIAFSTRQLPAAIKYRNKIHLSKSRIFKTYYSFWTRRNWALKKKVDQITLRLTESGLVEYWNRKAFKYPMKKLKDLEKIEESSEISQIDSSNLSFANIFMAMMLIVSIIVFFIEICWGGGIKYSQPRKKKLFLKQKIVIINKRIVILNKFIREP